MKKPLLLIAGLFYFFLALLSKESAIAFIGVLPLVLYFFVNKTTKQAIHYSIPLMIVSAAYLALRYIVVGLKSSDITDIVNAPFLLATPSQAFATKVFILSKYLGLLLFPFPLSWEYGYNQIPYIQINSIKFIFSLFLILSLSTYALFTLKKKSLISFCILYFAFTIALVSNFILDTGTPLAERFLFQPSLAFCIAIAFFYLRINEKSKVIASVSLGIILLLFSVKTFLRNGEWKNNETLAFADVISCPNSIRTNMAAAYIYLSKTNTEADKELKKDYFKKAVYYSKHALEIYPNNPRAQLDLDFAYSRLYYYYNAVDPWLKECNLNPDQPRVKKILEGFSNDFYKRGNDFFEHNNIDSAIKYYLKAIEFNDRHVEAWYNLGGNYYIKKDTINALKAWEKVRVLAPDHSLKKEDFLTTN